MSSVSPGCAGANMDPTQGQGHPGLFGGGVLPGPGRMGNGSGSVGGGGSGYYVSTSDGASTCSSSTTEPGEGDSLGGSTSGGPLLVLEPKSLRSFETNDEYLYAMQEDLADWFSCLYQTEVTADSFFSVLETGVLLCRHANKVQENARQMRERGETLEMRSYFIRSVPERNVQFRENVRPETFQARDNISNFISWGRQLGIPEVLSFETDDLVLRKNEKSVILCLLELARVGAKLGMLAPTLVQMEEEIDAELAGEEPKPQVQVKTCDMRSLDERVRDLIGRCTCPIQFPMIKVGDGKYKIGDSRSLIFVRILRNHVMVRVGGGWDTLENYLNKHDPCQCNYRGHRAGTAQTAHKIQVNQSQQQRRASTPGNAAHHLPGGGAGGGASVTNTPTSPRRMSSAAPIRNRSVSPHNQQQQQGNQGTAGSGNGSSSTLSSAAANKQNPPRSKSPTLIISRHTPSAAGGGGATGKTRGGASVTSASSSFSVNRVSSNPSSRAESLVSKSWSQPLSKSASANNTNNNSNSNSNNTNTNSDSANALSSQPNRCKSPSPGRLRSPSPLSVPKTAQQQSPAPFTRTASGSSLVKGKGGQGQEKRVTTPRRLPGTTMISDNEEDENESYQADEDDDDYDCEGADDYGDEIEDSRRERAEVDNVEPAYADDVSDTGSVSFDERAEWSCDQRSSSSSLDKAYDNGGTTGLPGSKEGGAGERKEEEGADKSSVSMDKISTMTLTEFKSLLNSNLSVPEGQQADATQRGREGGSSSSGRSPAGSSDSGQQQPNWDSLREKARSVRDSISNSVSNRRTSTGATGSAVGRRSLPQSPDGSAPSSSFERPKTPQALRRNRNPSSGRTSPVSRPKTPTSVSRPKTPTSSAVSRPKTPTSGIARPKTPTSAAPREEYRMSRPKTPSQVKRDAVAKVAGAISNWVDSRPDVASISDRPTSAAAVSRPKTPTSRPKTPTRQQATTRRWDGGEDGDADVDDDFEDDDEVSGLHTTRAVPAAARDRPSTPSRIPKPSFLPRPTTPKISGITMPSDPSCPSSRERPHTSLGHTSSSSLSLSEQEIIQRQQQLQRLQQELEDAQQRAEEDRQLLLQQQQQQQQQLQQQVQAQEQQQRQRQQPHAARPNFLPTNSVSRSNSSASSDVVQSPSASLNGGSVPKSKIAASRRLPLPRGSSEDSGSYTSRSYRDVHTARRCVTPGPGTGEVRVQPSRAVTPGPREKWSIGSGSSGLSRAGQAPGQERRGSLNTGAVTERDASAWRRQTNQSDRNNNIHNNNNTTASNGNLNSQQANGEMTFTNEITFSDDEEINELVRNAALMNGTGTQQASDATRVRSASVDARRLERQTVRRSSKGGEEVLMIRRDPSGGHAVEMVRQTSANSRVGTSKDKPPTKGIVRRPQKPQGSGIVKSTTSSASVASAAGNSARFRSQTPDPSMFRQKLAGAGMKPAVARPTTPSGDSQSRTGKPQNRTEAWVDSTLSDPKRKLPSKPRRARGGTTGEISASELAPRPLEEIQAMLSTPRDGGGAGGASGAAVDTAGLDAPPEDPEMFRKMEKLFEKYREMELRASVNETPGGPPLAGSAPGKNSTEAQSSGKPGSLKSSGGAASSSGKQSLSLKTSSSGSGGAPGSTSQRIPPSRQSSMNSSCTEPIRYQRASSVPHQQRMSVSALNSPSTELREFSGDVNRHRAVSQGEGDQRVLEKSLKDIDPETAKDPAALITKIKEILKVRPRRDENAQIARTRIPAPSSLTRSSRSKSVSNLFTGPGGRGESASLSVSTSGGRGVLKHTSSGNGGGHQQGKLNRANSGSSGNISYSEFVFHDEDESVDNVPELSKAWSVKSDSSDSQTRCETPVPKLATPLTTGRSTLISRMGRSLSQDKENNLSNSQTSLSGRSALSTTEEDADYV